MRLVHYLSRKQMNAKWGGVACFNEPAQCHWDQAVASVGGEAHFSTLHFPIKSLGLDRDKGPRKVPHGMPDILPAGHHEAQAEPAVAVSDVYGNYGIGDNKESALVLGPSLLLY